ncbi:MAG TPA: uroporphyrinogen-III C-methyltransferase [Candidatus Sulfotelmatobacter sp.]|jgi:uroporphyrin-III C-methyltransferase|nr:uroporphyrinogen-III C-methyltransferase [Candidatus Sulfotelmatobacter sp.]
MDKLGQVYLVGAGPGDPDLLTVKALRLLWQAEAVVYDRLVSPEIVDLANPEARRISVGKESGRHSVPQEQINLLLESLAREGLRVVRLKGGDPFIFGRGGEEALHLAAAGIPCSVVPGVTAAAGCGAAAGIPLTHRGLAGSVRLITGHGREDQDLRINWASLTDPDCTLVFYMGIATAPLISAKLIEAGLPADTPAAAIERGTLPGQRVHVTSLEKLPAVAACCQPPTLLVVGRVVTLSPQLLAASLGDWREAAE